MVSPFTALHTPGYCSNTNRFRGRGYGACRYAERSIASVWLE